ncbi:MAG: DUF4173 domain-containing protein [Alphaproteobacteria bacterium]|nr:DUF4173 domain-containing protein [Alphaproteobacteria bacterium]
MTTTRTRPSLLRGLAPKILFGLGFAALADALFYGAPAGWTAGLYGGILLAALFALQPVLFREKPARILLLLLATLLPALVDEPGMLRVSVFAAGVFTLPLLQRADGWPDATRWLRDMGRMLLDMPLRTVRDDKKARAALHRRMEKRKPVRDGGAPLRHALATLGLFTVFLCLFSMGNPIIARAMGGMMPVSFAPLFSPQRWLFWLVSFSCVWTLLRPRFKTKNQHAAGCSVSRRTAPGGAGPAPTPPSLHRWVSRSSLVWSLLLFNALFAVQNTLDILYLWRGGARLPDGMSYAAYAHAGAYPLVVTALLAAAYVLSVFRDEGAAHQSAAARRLVLFWVGQNIFLVFSAICRLRHYIEAYSLTELRFAAMVWMALVAGGLALITARIVFSRGNRWLVNANALMLAAVLYACCFVEIDGVIASYNVRHAREVTGRSQDLPLDLWYMRELGTAALPALAVYAAHAPKKAVWLQAELRKTLDGRLHGDWRAWTWHDSRILAQIQGESPYRTQRGR